MSTACLGLCLALLLLAGDLQALKRERKRKKNLPEELENVAPPPKQVAQETDGQPSKNPCQDLRCSAGQECAFEDDGSASCRCVDTCPEERDPRRKVCSNLNETWDSDCALHRMRCLCSSGDERCPDERLSHQHVDYYGGCQALKECTRSEMEDFPFRMREWLANVLQELFERRELTGRYEGVDVDPGKDRSLRWADAAVWKWCDLDADPTDRRVSRHELFPIRAPLLSMEHCMAPFLDRCDADGDHFITMEEWGVCLEMEKELLDKKCEALVAG